MNDISTAQIFLYIIAPIVFGLVGYIMKTMINRLDTLEFRMQETITEPEVRIILDDKLDPIHEDLKEIKHSLNQLYEVMLNLKR